MTTWLCVSSRTTVLTLLCLPPLIPTFYCLMEKKQNNEPDTKTTNFKEIPYSPLNPTSTDYQQHLSCWQKLLVIRENSILFISAFIGFFCEYLCIQSIITTLAFPNAPFSPRDHYQYYVLALWFGELLGRSYGLIVSTFLCCSSIPAYTKHTWIFTSFIVASLLLLVFGAWFRFLHSVWIVLGAVLFVGLNTGALYSCTYAAAAQGSSSRHIGFCRAFLNIAVSAGMIIASLLGLRTELLLKERCLQISENKIYCLTRVMSMTDYTKFLRN